MSILMALLPVAIQILGFFLDKSAADKATKQRFFEWVKLAGEDFGSVKLMNYGDGQLKWFTEHPFEETK